MLVIPSQKFIHRWFSITLTSGVLIILFLVIVSYKQPKSALWQYYDNWVRPRPGDYLKYVSPNPFNQSYCKFNFNLPKNFTFSEGNIHGTPEQEFESDFRVVYHVLEVPYNKSVPLVTYATHLTYEFINYLVELVRFWDGLVSAAIYLPDGNPNRVLEKIVHFCYCVPEMSKVSIHFVFPKHMRLKPLEAQFKQDPPITCDIPPSSAQPSNRNAQTNLTSWYPVNVCRNVARGAAFTEYILVSDVELLPTQDLAKNFLTMLNNYRCRTPDGCHRVVYVVPVFEVDTSDLIPRTKTQLLELIKNERAVYFHQLICPHCQKFPGLPRWLESDPGDAIKPFVTTKREVPYNRWEPLFIGTKDEPFYNEGLSWEGFQDKMLQMLEMCLMDYRLIVLDGAFLVHWPGIRKVKTITEPWRSEYIRMNMREYDAILGNITEYYPLNPRCLVKKNYL